MTEFTRRVAVALAIAATAAIGCGGEEEPAVEGPAADKLRAVQEAFEERDFAEVCESLTLRAQLLIAFSGHTVVPDSCVTNVRKLHAGMRKGGALSTPEVISSRRVSGGAIATVRMDGAPPVDVALRQGDGGWKLDGVFSAKASSFQRTNGVRKRHEAKAVEVPAVASAPPDETPVYATTARRRGSTPCSQLSVRGTRVRGGCAVELSGDAMTVDISNALGRMPFADCGLFLGLRMGASGRVAITQWASTGPQACGDIKMCKRKGQNVPWLGRVTRSDGATLRLHLATVCLDTCVGLYRGDWTLGLRRAADGYWRMQARRAAVGRSGFRFDGTLVEDFGGAGLAVQARPPT